MGGLFSLDGGLFTFLGKLCDLFIVSLLWLICCIPIVTIGLSTTSLYYATVKVIRRERGYLTKEFFRCMKTNLKQGLIIGGALAVIMALLVFNLLFTNTTVTQTFQLLHNVYLVFIVVIILLMFYIYPLLSRFEMKTSRYFTFSLYLIIRHFLTTVVCAALFVGSVVGVAIMPIAIVLLPAFCCYMISFMMEKILKKYTPDGESGTTEGVVSDADGAVAMEGSIGIAETTGGNEETGEIETTGITKTKDTKAEGYTDNEDKWYME